ncbi:hypothetical protein A0U93_11385 [Neoasaia chiangmaiensis]|uniref:UvrD-like helicase C-terminal domain-containing protein n=1 Tax=Neoasaia chiangmaiensis TaxID=320497 RepID=A0A1U9KRU6_9PROT|nr:hypothetical protein A0U93_11385 [Neoasaia chiangmaiensis]
MAFGTSLADSRAEVPIGTIWSSSPWTIRVGWTYGPGDKVMQIANDYDRDVFNGDLGVIDRIDVEEGELTVLFDGREVVYGFGELDELVLAYATTIHKSQGSEYPAVVIPLVTHITPCWRGTCSIRV